MSKYPAIVRDISFVVDKDFAPNVYFDLVRDVEEILRKRWLCSTNTRTKKSSAKVKKSYAYRITYRSNDRTLAGEEIDVLHKTLEKKTAEEFGGENAAVAREGILGEIHFL